MASYRGSRSLEASLIQYIETKLVDDNWTNVTTSKVLAKVYKQWSESTTVILVNVLTKRHIKKEMGNTELEHYYFVSFRIFGTDDGNRLDLSEWLIDKIKIGCIFYEYETEASTIVARNEAGRVVLMGITDDRAEFLGTDVEKQDRYRHIITCEMYVGKA